ncbi:sugar porter (SP) family MFS transporter [Coccidioides immitis RS]|uniref:Sugar porter (SP) family MFS transporter n=1 Tax=Coccidioides immitis (strain RS) TaxID=246410 RepID=J3K4Q2_COCIM|nr:sugar porter (SP) family MFS transporter [Coccidioides immitis RS]EAS29308.3 sugar porter (SP) family MFS transporter [Coccidioides immitis RS]
MREKRLDPEVPVANDGHSSSPSVSTGKQEVIREETIRSWVKEGQENGINNKLRNPLSGMTKDELFRDVETFALEKGLMDVVDDLKKGALIAQDPKSFELLDELSEAEKELLRREKTHKWNQPFMMYFMTILCAGSAIVQGMDQTAVNGAQEFYFDEFNVTDVWQQGLLNGTPYLCSALIGCWTTAPLNRYFGRRGCIFISCFVSFASSFWMATAHTWWNLLLARFLLGFAVGAKSTTTPVYGAECSPANIRGALVMMWQMWTAFGIMLGYIASVAFMDVKVASIPGFNWRLMLASTAIPPFFVCIQVYLCPESPRWYMMRDRYQSAYNALCKLRPSSLQAARDLYYIHASLRIEEKLREGKRLWKEMFGIPRNRRAAQSSFFVMFMQQFCGVNAIMYYSSSMFRTAGFSQREALITSLGCGITNWIFALPAVYTIDTFGRRNLLLTTFPLMSLFLLFTGFSFWIPDLKTRTACVATGIYLFMIVYSPGEGPVPFTYSAEAFPLYIRDIGMSFATATTWGFNFVISLTWPALEKSFKPQGAFGWYAAWNIFGWVFCYFCLPETKALSLEELDQVFSVPTRTHINHYRTMLPWYFKKYVLRSDVPPQKQLYDYE